jgi:hypothetical protein
MTEEGRPRIYGIVPASEMKRRAQGGRYNPDLARQIATGAPILLGLALLVEGEDRFKTPGFAPARQIMSGWPWASAHPGLVWGLFFLILGLLMAAYAWHVIEWVFWPAFVVTVGFAFWTILLGVGAVRYNAPWTGPAVYSWVTLCMGAVAVGDARWVDSALKTLRLRRRKG